MRGLNYFDRIRPLKVMSCIFSTIFLVHRNIGIVKYRYFKNGAVPISDIFWVLILLRYFCMHTPDVPKLKKKKKKNHFLSFFLLNMS
jgi:hypothetical protein